MPLNDTHPQTDKQTQLKLCKIEHCSDTDASSSKSRGIDIHIETGRVTFQSLTHYPQHSGRRTRNNVHIHFLQSSRVSVTNLHGHCNSKE